MLPGMRSSLVVVLAALATLALVACKGPAHPSQTVPAERTACQADTDCTIVTMGCCDACNGGWDWSVNVKAADEAKARFGEACQADERCTLLDCEQEPVAVCSAGVCATRGIDGISHNEIREKR